MGRDVSIEATFPYDVLRVKKSYFAVPVCTETKGQEMPGAIRRAALNRVFRFLAGWPYCYRVDQFDAWFVGTRPDDGTVLGKLQRAATIARVVRSPHPDQIVRDESRTIPIASPAHDQ